MYFETSNLDPTVCERMWFKNSFKKKVILIVIGHLVAPGQPNSMRGLKN